MELTPLQEQALARWHDLGQTTPGHPVLQLAYELYYQPLGLMVDALSYDALAAIENRDLPITLVNPRWSASKVDRTWGEFSKIEPLVNLSEALDPIFDSDGTLLEFKILKNYNFTDDNNSMMSTFMESGEVAKIKEFEEKHAPIIFDLADQLAFAAKLYIDASMETLLQRDKFGEEGCRLFLSNPRRFATAAFEVFTQQGK